MTCVNPINTKKAKFKDDLKKIELNSVSSIKTYFYIIERKKRTKKNLNWKKGIFVGKVKKSWPSKEFYKRRSDY